MASAANVLGAPAQNNMNMINTTEMEALPVPKQEMMAEGEHKMPEADVNSMIFFSGCFCCTTSCYLDFPAGSGCEVEEECLCIKAHGIACKPGDMKEVICTCNKSECLIQMPKPWIKCQAQECCIDYRCALPFAPDVPNLCGYCFIACLKDFKPNIAVFKKVGEMK